MSAAMRIDRLAEATIRRISYRLLPFLILAYLVCYIDRVNAGFAALQMNKALGISPAIFGLGGGIFFISYCLFEVPSNLALERFGARRWIARIMISWGIVSGLMAASAGPGSFVLIRFLLGAAEAGFFPGVILYLTYWFPAEQRAKIVSIFMVAIPVSGFIGAPISAALLGLDGFLGLAGWRWLFILEAIPAVILGLVAMVWLTDKPEHASWLAAEQRDWLARRLADENRQRRPVEHVPVLRIIRNRYVLAMALVYAGGATASSGLGLWMPQYIKSFGVSTMATGWLTALPSIIAAVAMVWWGFRSDRNAERYWHTLAPLLISGVALVLCVPFSGIAATVALLCLSVTATAVTPGSVLGACRGVAVPAQRRSRGGHDQRDRHRDGVFLQSVHGVDEAGHGQLPPDDAADCRLRGGGEPGADMDRPAPPRACCRAGGIEFSKRNNACLLR